MLDAWKVAKRFRALDLAGQRDVLDLFTKSAGEVLDRWFESGPIKAAFGFDAVVGNYASPYTPGSAYVLLHHVFGEVNGQRGQWGHARGGMGAIAGDGGGCATRGVALRTGAAVARVIIDEGKARASARGRRIVRAEVVAASIRSSSSSGWSRPSTSAGLPGAHRYIAGSGVRMNVAQSWRSCAAREERTGASRKRHCHRAVARLHGARLLRRQNRRLVGRADRRAVAALGRRRHPRAARNACREPFLPACASRSREIAARTVMGDARDEVAA
jgi:hypothetical protein